MSRNVKVIKLEDGELWWGGAVKDSAKMPYGNNFARHLQDSQSSQAMPLLISNHGRYIWCDYPFEFSFENENIVITYDNGEIITGENYGDLRQVYKYVSQTFFPASGVPDPINFLYPQYNTWIEMGYEPSQYKVLKYADEILAHGFPPGTLMIDDNWMKDYGVWDFEASRFPDPKKMIDELHEKGFRVMVWVCPYLSPDGIFFLNLKNKDLVLKDFDGKPVICEWWNGYSGVLDMSNEESVNAFIKQLDTLIEKYNVDGFKFDAGAPFYFDKEANPRYSLKRQMYPNEDCEVYSKIGARYKFSECRESWKAAGYPLIQRQVDKPHTWDEAGLGSLIPQGIAEGLLGYSFICPDMVGGGLIGSFMNNGFALDQELFVRYAQCSALFPVMQFSIAPWKVLDEEHLGYCMNAVQIRNKFSRYILELAMASGKTGEPILRCLEYEYPNMGYGNIKDEFLLGSDILVAPVLTKNQYEREVIIPPGIWEDDMNNTFTGPAKIKVHAGVDRLPYFGKK